MASNSLLQSRQRARYSLLSPMEATSGSKGRRAVTSQAGEAMHGGELKESGA